MAQDIETLVVSFRADIKRYEASLQATVRKTKAAANANERKWKSSNKRIRMDFEKTGRSMRSSLLLGAAAIGGAAATRVIAGFEQSMASVRAVTGATADEFKNLEEKARQLGATTRYSAAEAADGMLFLGRAGFTTDEILASIGPNLKLAQVGMIDLGDAADISSNILQGFRLEAGEMDRVVDVMAKTVNSSNTDIRQLGDGMKLVAPVAAGMGVELEETAAAIGALSNAGLQATLAGTGLRRVLAELESPTTKSQKILKQYGVTLEEVKPTAVGLTAALQRLSDAGVDTGDALALFGQRGGPAFEVLSSSVKDIESMTSAFKDAEGTAAEMAFIMDDTLAGAMKRALSRLQEFILVLGEIGAEKALTDMFNGLAEALGWMAEKAEQAARAYQIFTSNVKEYTKANFEAVDALDDYDAALRRTNGATGQALVDAERLAGYRAKEAIETIRLAEAERQLAIQRLTAQRNSAQESMGGNQRGGSAQRERQRENIIQLNKQINELNQSSREARDTIKSIVDGTYATEAPTAASPIIPPEAIVNRPATKANLDKVKDDLAAFLMEAETLFSEQIASEKALLASLQDARDEMHGRQIAIMQREYAQRMQQINDEILNEERKAEAIRLLNEERAEAERQLRQEALGQGEFSEDPLEVLREEENAKLDLLNQAREAELVSLQEYEQRKLEIIRETEEAITKARGVSAVAQISAYQGLFGAMSGLAKEFAGEQSDVYKALFAVEKAFAIASSLIAIQTGVAQALSLPFPMNLGAAATVAAQGASVISNIRSVSNFRDGAVDIGGAGSSRSDSIPAMISRGESVINAAGTAKNKNLLSAINAGANVEGALGLAGPAGSTIDASVIIQGNVTEDVLPVLEEKLAQQRDAILRAVPTISRAVRRDDEKRGR